MERTAPLFRFDEGWVPLIGGLVLLALTMVLPAQNELRAAEVARDRAIAAQHAAFDRLRRHSDYEQALRNPSEGLVVALAAQQLGIAPGGTRAVLTGRAIADQWAGLPDQLEAPVEAVPEHVPTNSLLHRLTSHDLSRLVLSCIALFAIAVGLLPPTVRRRVGEPATDENTSDAASDQDSSDHYGGDGVAMDEEDDTLENTWDEDEQEWDQQDPDDEWEQADADDDDAEASWDSEADDEDEEID